MGSAQERSYEQIQLESYELSGSEGESGILENREEKGSFQTSVVL